MPNHNMSNEDMLKIKNLVLAPYIQLSITLVDKPRRCGGNMFRHQNETMGVLIDYGCYDAVLLKAAIVHDLVEDCEGFDQNRISSIDSDGPDVLSLVLEVSKIKGESKAQFLTRILTCCSFKAKLLKCADRISNMISLGQVNDMEFVKRYIKETEKYVYPIADEVNKFMLRELIDLVESRRILIEELEG